jgi:hypothetical protein
MTRQLPHGADAQKCRRRPGRMTDGGDLRRDRPQLPGERALTAGRHRGLVGKWLGSAPRMTG